MPQPKQSPIAKDAARIAPIAFDRESVRTFDEDGMMHVSRTPISKANICGYYGYEIDTDGSMGLESNKLYKMLRDPDELAKAADTFNRKPVLNRHIAVTVSNPPKDAIIGSTGEGAVFDGTYLSNSMVVWDDVSIAGIESNQQREISSSYRYRADMTPGVYNGEEYDGVMRDLVCNHVAVVPTGRAGSDVLVHDSKPKGYMIMSKLNALMALLKPRLAADADPEELEKDLKNIVEDEDEEEKKDKKEANDEDEADKKADDEDEESEEEAKKRKEAERKEANDAAVAAAGAHYKALREAERICAPIIGNVACDSAEEVFRMTLQHAGVKGADKLHPEALRPMVEMLQTQRNAVAQDSAPARMSNALEADVLKMIRGGK